MASVGLLLLYVDVFWNGIDVLPDLLGYILLFIVIFRGWFYRKQYSSTLLVYGIITAAAFMLTEGERASVITTLCFGLITAVWQWLLVRRFYRENEGEQQPQRRLVQTALLGILFCQIGAPVLSVIPYMGYGLALLQAVLGIMVAIWTRRAMKGERAQTAMAEADE